MTPPHPPTPLLSRWGGGHSVTFAARPPPPLKSETPPPGTPPPPALPLKREPELMGGEGRGEGQNPPPHGTPPPSFQLLHCQLFNPPPSRNGTLPQIKNDFPKYYGSPPPRRVVNPPIPRYEGGPPKIKRDPLPTVTAGAPQDQSDPPRYEWPPSHKWTAPPISSPPCTLLELPPMWVSDPEVWGGVPPCHTPKCFPLPPLPPHSGGGSAIKTLLLPSLQWWLFLGGLGWILGWGGNGGQQWERGRGGGSHWNLSPIGDPPQLPHVSPTRLSPTDSSPIDPAPKIPTP